MPPKLWLFHLVFIAAGVALAIWGWSILERARASAAWPTMTGTVVSSDVRSERTPGKGVTYWPEVHYEYVVDGTTYSSNRIRFGEYGTDRAQPARAIANRYRTGDAVVVHIDPEDPARAVLEAGAGWSSYGILGGGVLFLVVGIVSLVRTLAGSGGDELT
jgi:hypothetical protein